MHQQIEATIPVSKKSYCNASMPKMMSWFSNDVINVGGGIHLLARNLGVWTPLSRCDVCIYRCQRDTSQERMEDINSVNGKTLLEGLCQTPQTDLKSLWKKQFFCKLAPSSPSISPFVSLGTPRFWPQPTATSLEASFRAVVSPQWILGISHAPLLLASWVESSPIAVEYTPIYEYNIYILYLWYYITYDTL